MIDLRLEKVNHEEASMRKRIFDFLAPHEAYCLFITGNLKQSFPDSHIYIARDGENWAGVAGYYGIPRSIVLFSFQQEVARALTRHVAERHPDITGLCAAAHLAEPGYEELRRAGYELTDDPRCVFMQLDMQPPLQPFEEFVRMITAADFKTVRLLHQYLQNLPQEPPVTDEELLLVGLNPTRVLAVDGEIVATASTNGMGISAFQILGVVTKPEHRNKGYARAVCGALIHSMWAEGSRQCILFTQIDNIAAQACYKKLGFRIVGEYWVARFKH